MKAKLRFMLVIAITLAVSAVATRATQEQEETFGDKLKKLFVRPTPTPKHRKKKKPSATPTVSPVSSESPSATPNLSPPESPTSSIAPSSPSATALSSETAHAAPAPTETRKATRVEEGQPQYLEPVRPISPGPRSRRRRGTPRITPTPQVTPISTATQTPASAQTPAPTTPAPKQTPAPTSTPTEAQVSRPLPSLPPVIKSSPSPAAKKTGTPKATISVADISDSESYTPDVKKVIDLSFDLTTQNLSYKYASADPAKGGMDCSGFIYYVLSKCGIKDVPRDAREQYIWVRKAGNFQAVLAQRDDTFELDALKPGDLLFWASNYGVSRDPDITQTMIYLGRDAERNQRLMIGASESNAQKGQRRVGVGVFDFKFGRNALKPKQESGPVFVGYGHIPGLDGK